jgi:putative tryptophan/tyrosine transport system substrate-binding protein
VFVRFWSAARRLAPGVALIVLASGILLLSDAGRRDAPGARRLPRVAIIQHVASPVMDAGVQGMIDGLAAMGLHDGATMSLTRYNANGDMATGNAIARQVTTGEFDLVVTSSTPSMQAVANANREGRTNHVFGLVADPFSAGVGLDRADPMHHPRYMVGYGTFLPVRQVFEVAKRALPPLQRIGVAWNPAESNSRAFVDKAREAAGDLGVTLLEANVDASAGVMDAIHSLAARGAQAIWVGGDNTMMSAMDTVITTARDERIPVLTITPGAPDRGTLVDIGLDFHALGDMCGRLAASVLQGTDPASLPIRDVQDEVPHRLIVNLRALDGLRDPWHVPDDIVLAATTLVDRAGVHQRPAVAPR